MHRNSLDWNITSTDPGSGEPFQAVQNGFPYSKMTTQQFQKPRNKFTLSSNTLSRSFTPKIQEDDVNLLPSTPISSHSFEFGNSNTLSLPLTKTRKSHHNSMENLRKPKNHRSMNHLPEKKTGKGAGEFGERLVQGNIQLMKQVDDTRRESSSLKVISAFAFEAFRRQRQLNSQLEEAKQKKVQEAAARMILHKLLLNCWRTCKVELENLLDDNAQLNKSMENLSLQLRVVRHLQSVEREKSIEKTTEVDRLNLEIHSLKQNNEKSTTEIQRMENELNSLQARIQNLHEQSRSFEEDCHILEAENEVLGRALDEERIKTGSLEEDNFSSKKEALQLETKLKEATSQSNHWQEQSKMYESEVLELKHKIECKDGQIREMQETCQELTQLKLDLISTKTNLKQQLDTVDSELEQLNLENQGLSDNLEEAKVKVREQSVRLHSLERAIEITKSEYIEIERELLKYKLVNVKRRRDWANALYFLVNPVDAFRRSYANKSCD